MPPIGTQDETSISVDGGHPGSSDEPKGNPDCRIPPKPPKTEHKGHTPITVRGPKGVHRRVVESNSLGLQLAYEPLLNHSELWQLDTDEGVLVFNTQNPLFVKCDNGSASALIRLQELVVFQALTLHMVPEDHRVAQRQILDEFNLGYVTVLLQGDALRRRAKGNFVE